MIAVPRDGTRTPVRFSTIRTAQAAILAAVAAAVASGLAWPLPLAADLLPKLGPDPLKASSGRAARQSALRSIPLDKLDADGKAKVASVLSDATFFRRLPVRVIQCDPELYLFLVRHPDVVANLWQLLGVTQLAVRQIGPDTFRVIDAVGTEGTIQYLYRSHDTHVVYTEGSYEGPLFTRPVRGRGLMILKTGYVREPDGRYYITNRLDAFMNVDHLGAELVTKTFQPLVGKVADINFTQTAGFLGSLSRTAEKNPPGVQRLAGKLTNLQPGVREEFAQLAARVAEKAAAGKTGRPEEPPLGRHPRVAERPPQGGTR